MNNPSHSQLNKNWRTWAATDVLNQHLTIQVKRCDCTFIKQELYGIQVHSANKERLIICTLPIIVYNTNCTLLKTFVSPVLSTDLTYSRIPGDHGRPLFSDLRIVLAIVLCTNLYYNLYLGYKIVSKLVQNDKLVCAKLYVTN